MRYKTRYRRCWIAFNSVKKGNWVQCRQKFGKKKRKWRRFGVAPSMNKKTRWRCQKNRPSTRSVAQEDFLYAHLHPPPLCALLLLLLLLFLFFLAPILLICILWSSSSSIVFFICCFFDSSRSLVVFLICIISTSSISASSLVVGCFSK